MSYFRFIYKKRVRYESLTPHSFSTDVSMHQRDNTQKCYKSNSHQQYRRLKI